SASILQLCNRLDLKPGGQTYACLRRSLRRLGVDVDRFAEGRYRRHRGEWTDDDLRTAVTNNLTVSGVLRDLGYEPSGGMHRFIVARLRKLEIDTTHFLGQRWALGTRQKRRRLLPLDQ